MQSMSKAPPNTLAQNRKARHDFIIEKNFDAGLVLEGWEVKSLRAGRGQLSEAYVIIRQGEAWLLNAHISPLETVSTHITPNPTRTRKLLLSAKELDQLIGAVQQKGYTIVPLRIFAGKRYIKCEIALAKGKKQHDKRQSDKDRSWEKTQRKIMKNNRSV